MCVKNEVHSPLHVSRLLTGGIIRFADAWKADAVPAPDIHIARIPSMRGTSDDQDQSTSNVHLSTRRAHSEESGDPVSWLLRLALS